MLTIKDLAVSKSLDCAEMSAIRGGRNESNVFNVIGGQKQSAMSGGVGSPVTQLNVGPTNAITTVQFDAKSVNKNLSAFGDAFQL